MGAVLSFRVCPTHALKAWEFQLQPSSRLCQTLNPLWTELPREREDGLLQHSERVSCSLSPSENCVCDREILDFNIHGHVPALSQIYVRVAVKFRTEN
jgi:hypothetical protein